MWIRINLMQIRNLDRRREKMDPDPTLDRKKKHFFLKLFFMQIHLLQNMNYYVLYEVIIIICVVKQKCNFFCRFLFEFPMNLADPGGRNYTDPDPHH